jgi:hypothetical protein
MGNLSGGKRVPGPSPSQNMDEQIWRDPVGKRPSTPSRSSSYVKPRASRLSQSNGTGLDRDRGRAL